MNKEPVQPGEIVRKLVGEGSSVSTPARTCTLAQHGAGENNPDPQLGFGRCARHHCRSDCAARRPANRGMSTPRTLQPRPRGRGIAPANWMPEAAGASSVGSYAFGRIRRCCGHPMLAWRTFSSRQTMLGLSLLGAWSAAGIAAARQHGNSRRPPPDVPAFH